MKELRTVFLTCAVCMLLMPAASCTKHEVDVKPVEIKPIHITVDVNVKIDKAVDDFFDDVYGTK